MAFTSHTAHNQSTVNPDVNHMTYWPAGLERPVSILVENIRTDRPDYMGDPKRWNDLPEWDEPAEADSIVTVTMANGATQIMEAPDLGDCMDPMVTVDGDWEAYITASMDADVVDEGLWNVMHTAITDARYEAINKWVNRV